MFEAEAKNHGGFYLLGEQHFFGQDCEINYEIAFECYKISAIVDVDYSYSRLGTMYQYGYGTEKDENLAIECYEKATPKDKLARIFLAELYHSASKEFQDFSKAYQWYQQIKGSNKSFALRGIGLLYEHGDLFEQDYQKAFDYYLQSAEDKNLGAYFNLAQLYCFGRGVDQSYTKCLEWLARIETEKPTDGNTYVYVEYGKEEFWRQCTDSKDRIYSILSEDKLFGKAYFFLGHLYTHGKGYIVRDAKKAARYFRMALEKEVEEAQIYIEEANKADLQSLSLVDNVSSNDDDISK
jgi:TPR repeat protein